MSPVCRIFVNTGRQSKEKNLKLYLDAHISRAGADFLKAYEGPVVSASAIIKLFIKFLFVSVGWKE